MCLGVEEALKAAKIATPVINIPGCPPRPDAIIYGVVKLLGALDPRYLELLDQLGEKRIKEIEEKGEVSVARA